VLVASTRWDFPLLTRCLSVSIARGLGRHEPRKVCAYSLTIDSTDWGPADCFPVSDSTPEPAGLLTCVA
jgi:hypothetical protein